MRKFKIVLILIVIISIFCSCSLEKFGLLENSRTRMLNMTDDDKVADALFEQIIETIVNKDKVAIKNIFSKQSLALAVDIDENVDNLFGFIQGEINSWERAGGSHVSELIKYGDVIKEVDSFYYIYTNKQKYFLLLVSYPIYDNEPDKVGLYMLSISKAEDEYRLLNSHYKIPGIYILE